MVNEHDANKALLALGITLPKVGPPQGNFEPYARVGDLLFVSGQVARWDGVVRYTGKVGSDLSIEEGKEAARFCAMNILAHVKNACEGDLNRVKRVVRVAGLVNCLPDFGDQPKVINGCSDFLCAVFGEAGRHARIATGASSLPSKSAVEVEALFQLHS